MSQKTWKLSAKWSSITACTILLSACGGGSTPTPAAGFTATFSPSTLTISADASVKKSHGLVSQDGTQITVTTTPALSSAPIITFADDTQSGKATYFGVTNCSTSGAVTTCDVTDSDPVTETVKLKVMVSDGTNSVQATPAESSPTQDITINTTASPTPPPTPPSGPCSFEPGAAKPCAYPARTNSAWLYDGKIACTGTNVVQVKTDGSQLDPNATCTITQTVGADSDAIIAFNNALNAGQSNATRGLNEVNVYAGDIEFLNAESGKPFTAFTLHATDHDGKELAYNGYKNINAYYNALKDHGISKFMAVVDGRIDALGVQYGWLWMSNTYNNSLINHNLNDLSPSQAVQFADHIASQFCDGNDTAATEVAGVQFDLEHFRVPDDSYSMPAVCDPASDTFNANSEECTTDAFKKAGWGQYLFYREMSKDLAGENPNLVANNICTTKTPKFFTLFTYPDKASEKHLAEMLNHYGNGYAIFSLYDLGGNNNVVPTRNYNGSPVSINTARAGFVTSAEPYYKNAVTQEIADIESQMANAPIHFQVGIPGSASAHEFAYSESPAYDAGMVDDRYAQLEPQKTGDPIYPDCALNDQALSSLPSANDGCPLGVSGDQAVPDEVNQYQANIVNDAMSATETLLKDLKSTGTLQYYIGMNLWDFNPPNVIPGKGEVLANNHWIPRASQSDTSDQENAKAFPNEKNIPLGPNTRPVTDQNLYVVCDASYKLLDTNAQALYLDGKLEGGCSGTMSGIGSPPVAFTDDNSFSHSPDEYVGMRFYYPNSIGTGSLTGSSRDIVAENAQQTAVLNKLKAYPDLMSTTPVDQ